MFTWNSRIRIVQIFCKLAMASVLTLVRRPQQLRLSSPENGRRGSVCGRTPKEEGRERLCPLDRMRAHVVGSKDLGRTQQEFLGVSKDAGLQAVGRKLFVVEKSWMESMEQKNTSKVF